MHTAVVELAFDETRGEAAIRIRVFADDLSLAIRVTPGTAEADSAMARYLRGTFHLTDRSGRRVPLRWEGADRTSDVMLLRLRAAVPEGLAGVRVASGLLCELFEDQVNIVRATYGGRATTLLFTRGDAAKVLP